MCVKCGKSWTNSGNEGGPDVCSSCNFAEYFNFTRIPLAFQIKLMFRNPEWAKAIRLPGPGPIGKIVWLSTVFFFFESRNCCCSSSQPRC